MKLSKIALAVTTLTVASSALAHGYIESPASRAYMCKLGQNTDCGSVQYEPQSVDCLLYTSDAADEHIVV